MKRRKKPAPEPLFELPPKKRVRLKNACRRCKRALTRRKSRKAGFGPHCAQKAAYEAVMAENRGAS